MPPSRKKPVVINDCDYPSIVDAAVMLNLHIDTVRRRVNSTLETWKNWRFKSVVNKVSKPTRSTRAVLIKGVRFESITAAAEALGVTYNTLYGRILSDAADYEGYSFADLTPCRIRANPDPDKPAIVMVRVNGKTYPNLRAAAKAEGITTHGLRNRKRQTQTASVEFINARTGELIC